MRKNTKIVSIYTFILMLFLKYLYVSDRFASMYLYHMQAGGNICHKSGIVDYVSKHVGTGNETLVF